MLYCELCVSATSNSTYDQLRKQTIYFNTTETTGNHFFLIFKKRTNGNTFKEMYSNSYRKIKKTNRKWVQHPKLLPFSGIDDLGYIWHTEFNILKAVQFRLLLLIQVFCFELNR